MYVNVTLVKKHVKVCSTSLKKHNAMNTHLTLLVLVLVVESHDAVVLTCLVWYRCRLFILGSYDRETYVHCTLELSSHEWKEKTRSSIKRVGSPSFNNRLHSSFLLVFLLIPLVQESTFRIVIFSESI